MSWVRDLGHKVLQFTHGRSTLFFIAFYVSGNLMAFLGKLTPAYAGYMGMLGALVLGHSIKEDVVAAVMGTPPPSGPDVNVNVSGGPHAEP